MQNKCQNIFLLFVFSLLVLFCCYLRFDIKSKIKEIHGQFMVICMWRKKMLYLHVELKNIEIWVN